MPGVEFNRLYYRDEFERLLNLKSGRKFFIKKSSALFKIRRYITKGTDSLGLACFLQESGQPAKDYWTITVCYYSMLYLAKAAVLSCGYETDDHYATQIALGHLLVPNELEREDLLLLEQAHKIFEDDYVGYFEEARKESSVSKYSPTKVYTERRVREIMEIARKFVEKVRLVLES